MKILLVLAAASGMAIMADKCGDINFGGGDGAVPAITQQ